MRRQMSDQPKYFTIILPTKMYLKKYISNKFGFRIGINKKNLIGIMVYNMALKKIDCKLSDEAIDKRLKNYDAELILVAPMSSMKSIGFFMTNDSIIQLNRFFERLFAADLYDYCKKNVNQDILRRKGYEKAIYEFADQFFINLDIDISFEALKRCEFRHRKKVDIILPQNDTSHFR